MKKLILLTILLFLSSSLLAESERSWWRVWETADEATGVTDRLFTSEEKRILRDYLQNQKLTERNEDDRKYKLKDKKHKKDKGHKGHKGKKQKSLPPGLQKKVDGGGQLPPGWQKKVAKGQVIDGDLYDISEDLPPGILRQLENVEGTSIRKIEDRVVRVMDATGEILDVLLGK